MSSFTPEVERVSALLREQIVSGVRAEGSRLVERDLAAEMGVSRVPVREALRRLVSEGLATPNPRTFTTVRRFVSGDIDDLIEVRSALETLAFRLAAERSTPEQGAALQALVAAELAAAERGDRVGARSAGADFHREIVALAGNTVLEELSAATDGRMRWLLNQHEDLIEMADEHRHLADAVVAGRPDRAAELAAAHLETSRRAALRLRPRE